MLFQALWLEAAALADEEEAEGLGGEEELEDVVQEVFLGSVAFPQEANELQLSAASSWVKADEADVLRPLLVGEWGFTDRLQLEVEVPFLVWFPSEGDMDGGLGNAEVGLFYNLVKSAESGLVLSGGVVGVLPTASTDLIDRGFGAGALLAGYKIMGPVHANLSVEAGMERAIEGDEDAEFGVETALSLLVPLGTIIPVAEVGVEHEEETELQLAGGFAWLAAEAIEVGVAGLMARGEEATDWGAVVNLTWERSLDGEAD